MAFRRPRNLKDMVVRTKLTNPLPNGGFKICTDGRCLMCKHSASTDSFESHVTGRSYKILGDTSCHTNNCIYLISCKVCGKQYVGETGDLRRRINNHRSTIKTKRIQEPVAEHFNLAGHKWQDMSVVVIDHNAHWTYTGRKHKEKFWMHRLKSFRPQGMNKMNDFIKMNTAWAPILLNIACLLYACYPQLFFYFAKLPDHFLLVLHLLLLRSQVSSRSTPRYVWSRTSPRNVPVGIRVGMGPPRPLKCRGRWMDGAVLRVGPEGPGSRVAVDVARWGSLPARGPWAPGLGLGFEALDVSVWVIYSWAGR